jgi:hypothetical protein
VWLWIILLAFIVLFFSFVEGCFLDRHTVPRPERTIINFLRLYNEKGRLQYLRKVVICILLDKDKSQKLADSYLTFGKWDQEVVL